MQIGIAREKRFLENVFRFLGETFTLRLTRNCISGKLLSAHKRTFVSTFAKIASAPKLGASDFFRIADFAWRGFHLGTEDWGMLRLRVSVEVRQVQQAPLRLRAPNPIQLAAALVSSAQGAPPQIRFGAVSAAGLEVLGHISTDSVNARSAARTKALQKPFWLRLRPTIFGRMALSPPDLYWSTLPFLRRPVEGSRTALRKFPFAFSESNPLKFSRTRLLTFSPTFKRRFAFFSFASIAFYFSQRKPISIGVRFSFPENRSNRFLLLLYENSSAPDFFAFFCFLRDSN